MKLGSGSLGSWRPFGAVEIGMINGDVAGVRAWIHAPESAEGGLPVGRARQPRRGMVDPLGRESRALEEEAGGRFYRPYLLAVVVGAGAAGFSVVTGEGRRDPTGPVNSSFVPSS